MLPVLGSVHASASRLAARPEVKSRIKALRLDSIAGSGPLTAPEIIRKLETIFRTASGTDSIKALQELNEHTGTLDDISRERKTEKIRPDPCAILAYVTGFAGKTGDQICQEMGGAKFLAAKLSEILKVPVTVDGVNAEDE